MNKPLRILMVEDSQDDAELLLRNLRQNGFDPQFQRVETAESMIEALNKQRWDIVISDYFMPNFSGIKALNILQEKEVDLPFIIVSGKIGEDTAVEVMKAGAHDYIMKENLTRLASAIQRELREAEIRHKRRQAEKEIKSSAEEWQKTFDVINEGIIILDINFNIVRANSATYNLLGKSPEETIKKKCCDLLHHEGKPIGRCPSLACLSSQKPDSIEYLEPKFNRWLNVASFPIINKENKPIGIVHVIRDITERVELEQRLQQSQKLEAVGQLAGGVAHDFNNLLQVIMGYSELLLMQSAKDDPMYEALEEINNSTKRAASLTRQLLAFSRKQTLQPEILYLNDLVANMEKMLRRIIGEDIELVPVYSPELKKTKADAGQIEQVLMNLVVNARDAMPDGGKLTIETRNVIIDEEYARNVPECKPGDFVCLSVQDAGTGMDKTTLQHIFEPFFTTKSAKGTGLGLSVVYGILKQHNGFINVYSEVGHGSLFKAYLPVLSEKEEIKTDKKMTAEETKSMGERILLVEDEEGVRKFASLILKRNGYTVFEAQNASDAIGLFEKENGNIDLLFTDMVLPDKTGLQLIDELLLKKPDLKFLVSSGYANHKSQWDTILERKINFIQKPYEVNDLLDIVRKTLSSG